MSMTEQLKKKVDFALRLLRSIPQDSPIEVSYSGGKDSDVILELAKMSGIPYRAIYKNTTIDPPETIKHCKSKGVEVFAPTIKFFDLVKKKGAPTRYVRHCCQFLKEYKVLDRAVQVFADVKAPSEPSDTTNPKFADLIPRKKGRGYICLYWNGLTKMLRSLSQNVV